MRVPKGMISLTFGLRKDTGVRRILDWTKGETRVEDNDRSFTGGKVGTKTGSRGGGRCPS